MGHLSNSSESFKKGNVLSHTRKVWGVAADDAHGGDLRDSCGEFFGGFIEVQAEEFRQQSIIEAIKKGSFYSSNGPEIYDIRIKDGRLEV